MHEAKEQAEWRVIGRSVLGAQHKRSNLPNQDAIRYDPDNGLGPPVILAISDGHGSPKCFRSSIGSQIAVRIATEVLTAFLKNQELNGNLSVAKRLAEERLPQELARRWQEEVRTEFASREFSAEELESLKSKKGEGECQEVKSNPLLAYGATLIIVVVTSDYLLFLQLGDGDILIVSESGEVARPLPHDARLMALETFSLCEPEPWKHFRIGFQVLSVAAPALIMVSTDGVSDSFPDNDKFFFKLASDALERMRATGVAKEADNLEALLNQISEGGSGDDITVGFIKRIESSYLEGVARQQEHLGQQQSTLALEFQSLKTKFEEQAANQARQVQDASRNAPEPRGRVISEPEWNRICAEVRYLKQAMLIGGSACVVIFLLLLILSCHKQSVNVSSHTAAEAVAQVGSKPATNEAIHDGATPDKQNQAEAIYGPSPPESSATGASNVNANKPTSPPKKPPQKSGDGKKTKGTLGQPI
jgi:serine/threonine protein phosphatase PrpC